MMHPVLMAFGTCYSVVLDGRMYCVRRNGDGSIDLFEEV